MVSATESRNCWMSSAMPVEARKKPKSMATTAGPGLRFPPRINTTRTIANSSTTDSEMATTHHTLGRSTHPAREWRPPRTPVGTIVPPTPLTHATGDPTSARPPCCSRDIVSPNSHTPYRNSRSHPAVEFRAHRFDAHASCAQLIRIVATGHTKEHAEVDISPESPANVMHHLVRMNEDRGAANGMS